MSMLKPQLIPITPALAAEWLARGGLNRNLMQRRVDVMAADMKAGRWVQTHQGIALNCNGTVRDGQHRLSAIVQSGVTVWFWVFTGLDDDAMAVIDTHKMRGVHDAMKIARHIDVGTRGVAIARRMKLSLRINDRQGESRQELIDFIQAHHEAIVFAEECAAGGARVKHASLLAPVARAWYTRDHDRLRHFVKCLSVGVSDSMEDSAALTLARYVMRERGMLQGGNVGRAIVYRKACAALVAFLERRPCSRLYEVTSEPFPIPGDEDMQGDGTVDLTEENSAGS